MTTILIGGDVCPVGSNEILFQTGDAQAILNDLLPVFRQADFTVLNLECPLIERESPIEKSGNCLGVSSDCSQGLVSIGINAVNLANNHILDHGEQGLRSTLSACKNAGINSFGAGVNQRDASQVFVHEINGQRFGFLGIAEHEFSIAEKNKGGANPIDIIEIVRVLRHTRNKHDFLTVLVHGGKEHYPYPTPRLQQLCRFLIEEGAGVVICQHSHCIGCYEYYQGALIVYGQGNLIFEPRPMSKPSVMQGILVKLCFAPDNTLHVEWIPFLQSCTIPGIRRMTPKQSDKCLNGFEQRSKEIISEETVHKKWLKTCLEEKYLHASRIRGHNRLLRILNKKLHFSDWFYRKKTKMLQQNTVTCEVHREALETLWRNENIDF
ncbi:Bacterial capsule synthesis protein PGA_cap [Desulfocapsa sulfexigens DSM 10523]|uniref:Bacterial capsule synthesis protein PGA_cap n=1 Tax=Desulfocapsa sulfexigens (strain DSM 10523 / SB164P1) TaxID=1167006 RepID=M1P9N0_DESSD|nr:CapA family protein [Desulfocapsa sulfexigens]AGF78362.1 Bacterial capsule synthesis protein PGA_cap [Desulfocapsa sulfexigens DSM 10523]